MATSVAKRRLAALGAVVLMLCAGCAGKQITPLEDVLREEEAASAETPSYRLRPGDEIIIDFAADPKLRFKAPITPSGTISLPMAGEITAAGMTPDELSEAIGMAMSPYLLDPTTSVLIESVGRRYVYVIGEVGTPGRIDMYGGLTISAALAEARGIESTGRPSSVMVVRKTGVERPIAFKVDVTKILSARDMSHDVVLRSDDVVYVPRSVIGKVGEFMDLFVDQIAPAQLFYLRGYDMAHLEDARWRF
jgi:protein involved in polysaccharide export with SLBB domain